MIHPFPSPDDMRDAKPWTLRDLSVLLLACAVGWGIVIGVYQFIKGVVS